MKFRGSVTVGAMQWDGHEGKAILRQFAGDSVSIVRDGVFLIPSDGAFGESVRLKPGDWLTRDERGKFRSYTDVEFRKIFVPESAPLAIPILTTTPQATRPSSPMTRERLNDLMAIAQGSVIEEPPGDDDDLVSVHLKAVMQEARKAEQLHAVVRELGAEIAVLMAQVDGYATSFDVANQEIQRLRSLFEVIKSLSVTALEGVA